MSKEKITKFYSEARQGPTNSIDHNTGQVIFNLEPYYLGLLQKKPNNFGYLLVALDWAVANFFGTDGDGKEIIRSESGRYYEE